MSTTSVIRFRKDERPYPAIADARSKSPLAIGKGALMRQMAGELEHDHPKYVVEKAQRQAAIDAKSEERAQLAQRAQVEDHLVGVLANEDERRTATAQMQEVDSIESEFAESDPWFFRRWLLGRELSAAKEQLVDTLTGIRNEAVPRREEALTKEIERLRNQQEQADIAATGCTPCQFAEI